MNNVTTNPTNEANEANETIHNIASISYADFYQQSIDQPDEFWAEQAQLI